MEYPYGDVIDALDELIRLAREAAEWGAEPHPAQGRDPAAPGLATSALCGWHEDDPPRLDLVRAER